MNLQMRAIILSGVLVSMLFLEGCRLSNPIPTGVRTIVTPSLTNPVSVYSSSSEMTSTIVPAATRTPSSNLIQTLTPDLTDTSQPTSTLTWTPRPTLPPDQAHAFALKMIRTNGSCSFPCWLGIVPGQTRTVEALNFLAPFADQIIPGGPYTFVDVYLVLSEPLGGGKKFGAGFSDENGIITVIQTHMPISLADLLSTYGPPSEILIRAMGWSIMGSEGTFILVLIYPKKGIMAVYDGHVARGKTLYISPDLFFTPQMTGLLLWSPGREMPFAEGGERLGVIADPPFEKDFLPLANVSNLTLQSFYQRYKDPQNSGLYFTMQAPDYPKDGP